MCTQCAIPFNAHTVKWREATIIHQTINKCPWILWNIKAPWTWFPPKWIHPLLWSLNDIAELKKARPCSPNTCAMPLKGCKWVWLGRCVWCGCVVGREDCPRAYTPFQPIKDHSKTRLSTNYDDVTGYSCTNALHRHLGYNVTLLYAYGQTVLNLGWLL